MPHHLAAQRVAAHARSGAAFAVHGHPGANFLPLGVGDLLGSQEGQFVAGEALSLAFV